MTLEDFFTLTEMKDGLTAPSRVEELVTVMQKDKDCGVKNVGDATRQWAAVASTIAATESEDCLDLFVKLDGLWFINRWLGDALKFKNDTSETFIDESITALLRALEKLHIDTERSISSGIWFTVKSLLGHSSSTVKDRARTLFDSWKQARDDDAEKVVAVDPPPKGSIHEESKLAESKGDEASPSDSSDGLQPERVKDLQIQTQNNQLHLEGNMGMDEKTPDLQASSILSNSVQENASAKAESPVLNADGTASNETCDSLTPKQGSVGLSGALKSNEFTEDGKWVDKVGSSRDKLGATDISSASETFEHKSGSPDADAATAPDLVTESDLRNHFDASDGDLSQKATLPGDTRKCTSEPKNEIDDMGMPCHHSTQELKAKGQDGECCPNTMHNLSGNESISGKPDDPKYSSSKEYIRAADERKDRTSKRGNSSTICNFSKLMVDAKSPDVSKKRKSDFELEYGMADALELARQVAQEVEREVDSREPFCSSSSNKKSEDKTRQPGSPESINDKEHPAIEVAPEVPDGQSDSAEAYSDEGSSSTSEDMDVEPENCSQVTEAAQEPEVNVEKGLCGFDLNEEVCSDDVDRSVNPVSATVSVVSASRPAAASGLPLAPLQFEGALGWKGIAATSAFRPASLRKTPDSDKALSLGGTCNSLKQRQDCLDIDLNVAEDGDDKVAELISGKQIPVSSGLPSGESSVEVSSRRSGRLKLDLNRIDDDGNAQPSDLRMEGRPYFHQNFRRSPSPASSSSSMQPSMRNFDLNDRPSFHQDTVERAPYQSRLARDGNAYGISNTGDPVISIMGTRVEVNRKDVLTQALPLPNGKAPEQALDAYVARTGGVLGMVPAVSYTHSPVFGYNGLTAGTSLSLSSGMYGAGGAIPYMVDSRGAHVMPQIIGSASAVPPYYSQPPFIMSLTGTPASLNGAGSSRPNFDLNSGFVIDGGNRDSGNNLRQLFIPGQVRPMEEPLRANAQPSSSSGVGKRKEPDSGWETHPFNLKLQQPPWK